MPNRLIERLPILKRMILTDVPVAIAAGWSIVAVLVPLGIRLGLDGGSAGVPFATFYPAVLVIGLLFGWRWGALVSLGSVIAVNRLLLHDALDPLKAVDFVLALIFFSSCAVLLGIAELARKLIRQLEQAKEQEQILKDELLHRVKNMLATMSAMEAMTARYTPPEGYRAALRGRIEALQRTTVLLGNDTTISQDLHSLLEHAVAPFRTPANMVLDGPTCRLPRGACTPLSLAVHELCTNAVKHGALSAPEGRVDLTWTVDREAGRLHLKWQERGGPQVVPPTREGMGTQLLRRQRELADVTLDYAPDGLVCTMTVNGIAEP